MNDLLNNDHLQDMFTIDDYTKSEEIPGYDITYIKRGDLLTIGIKQNNPVDRFKEYIDSLDDEIFDKVCNEYEEYTGQSLNDLSIKMKNNSLTEDEITQYKDLVRLVVLNDIQEKLNKYELLQPFLSAIQQG